MELKPDFFLIGAMKSGTTTLHEYLTACGSLYMSPLKEPGFFSQDKQFAKGYEWYCSLFDGASPRQLKGESSTCYSRTPTYPEAAKRIFDVNPKAKFIYLLRDPVKRAYSHYRHRMEEVRVHGGEFLTFKEALVKDEEMLFAGKYHFQVEQYLAYFPLNQFLFIKFENLISSPHQEISRVLKFLGVDQSELSSAPELIHVNESGTVYSRNTIRDSLRRFRKLPLIKQVLDLVPSSLRQKVLTGMTSTFRRSPIGKKLEDKHKSTLSRMDEDDTAFLRNYYEDDQQKLVELIGDKSFSHWKM